MVIGRGSGADEGINWIAVFRYLRAEPWNFSKDEVLGMTFFQLNVYTLPENMVHLKFDGDNQAEEVAGYQAAVKERDELFLKMLLEG